jgi:hypothetical protein
MANLQAAVTQLRRYLMRRPTDGGLLLVALHVGGDGSIVRMASRWGEIPEDDNYRLPWDTWDELV